MRPGNRFLPFVQLRDNLSVPLWLNLNHSTTKDRKGQHKVSQRILETPAFFTLGFFIIYIVLLMRVKQKITYDLLLQ
jgi:hypothetical protein